MIEWLSAEAEGGMVVKTIGDAYMAAFDELAAAVEFALRVEELLTGQSRWVGQSALELRTGIYYGRVYRAR